MLKCSGVPVPPSAAEQAAEKFPSLTQNQGMRQKNPSTNPKLNPPPPFPDFIALLCNSPVADLYIKVLFSPQDTAVV